MSNAIIGTGLSGLVGSRFVDLYSDKYAFENLDLTTGVDITKSDSVEKAMGNSQADVVIHLAAFTNVNEAFKQQDDKSGLCYQVNVVGTQNIAQACQKFGKHLIHISTDFIFDGTKTDAYTEEDKPNPIEWYGQTKYLAEEEVKKAGNNYTILRLAYPYRASHPMRVDMIRNVIEKLKSGTMYPPFADHYITPTFIDDIAKVFDIVAEKKSAGETFHLTGSSWHSDFEIAKLVQEVFELPGEIKEGSLVEYLKTANRPYQQSMKISNQKLIDSLDFTPKTLKAGLEEIKNQLSSE